MNTTTTAPLAVGTVIEMDKEGAYCTETGAKVVHTWTTKNTVTAVDGVGFTYKVTEVVAEANRPEFAGTPTGGTMAWFALPLYIARGTLRIV